MSPAAQTVFRLPRSAYLVLLFLVIGVTPMVQHPLAALVYLLPVLAGVFIARVATVVDEGGVTVRALLAARRVTWDHVRGVSVAGRNLYLVTDEGSMRMPCVRLADLSAFAAASAGRLPELPEATPKHAPSAHRR